MNLNYNIEVSHIARILIFWEQKKNKKSVAQEN